MGAGFSSIKPEQVAAAGLRPVKGVHSVQESKALPVKDKAEKEKKEEKDTTHQTVDEIQNKFGF